MKNYPYVITVSSEKGGVGKTTIATNLAIYLKALSEDFPVSIFSLDNHFTIDKMFAINGQEVKGDVADFLLGKPGSDILHIGQYGVNYIPSSANLSGLRDSIKGPMEIARLLALSNIPGVLIIDTKPELDVFTENSLYAADRVIIPVKDMPSLENCRNIFELFDKRGLDKKSLSLIPCLIDARIKYEGPFKDQKGLLRAYAINRGYRCMETFISKSPKVESLNTNPDGKIYPILTHARGTDVYGQFAELAGHMLTEIRAAETPRSLQFHDWLKSEERRKKDNFEARVSRLKSSCGLCSREYGEEDGIAACFYYEASDGGACGFVDESCLVDFLMKHIYNLDKKAGEDEQIRVMFRDSARESAFTLRVTSNGQGSVVEFCRFSTTGTHLAKKFLPLKEFDGILLNRERSRLYSLISETLGDPVNTTKADFLVIYPFPSENRSAILTDENYRPLRRLMQHIAGQLTVQPVT